MASPAYTPSHMFILSSWHWPSTEEVYFLFLWTWIDLDNCLNQQNMADTASLPGLRLCTGCMASSWFSLSLSLSGLLPFIPSQYILRKLRPHGEVTCGFLVNSSGQAYVTVNNLQMIPVLCLCIFQLGSQNHGAALCPVWISDLEKLWETIKDYCCFKQELIGNLSYKPICKESCHISELSEACWADPFKGRNKLFSVCCIKKRSTAWDESLWICEAHTP